jgi:hypothetical protein
MKSIAALPLSLALLALATAGAEEGHRSSYYKNGEIHVNVLGTPEEEPLTSGHWDFKPSWSKTGDMLVFFRRLVNHKEVGKWKTAIHVINVDGTGLHPLSDGTHTDFNQTWTRDGTNTPIWNRKNPESLDLGLHLSDRRPHSRRLQTAGPTARLLPDDAQSRWPTDV